MRHYHYTATATTAELIGYEAAAKKQDEAVLDFFKVNPDREMTPYQVHDGLIRWHWIEASVPITSIRRAMSNLVKRGRLVKCDTGKLERLGRGNHVWKLKVKAEQTRLF